MRIRHGLAQQSIAAILAGRRDRRRGMVCILRASGRMLEFV